MLQPCCKDKLKEAVKIGDKKYIVTYHPDGTVIYDRIPNGETKPVLPKHD